MYVVHVGLLSGFYSFLPQSKTCMLGYLTCRSRVRCSLPLTWWQLGWAPAPPATLILINQVQKKDGWESSHKDKVNRRSCLRGWGASLDQFSEEEHLLRTGPFWSLWRWIHTAADWWGQTHLEAVNHTGLTFMDFPPHRNLSPAFPSPPNSV